MILQVSSWPRSYGKDYIFTVQQVSITNKVVNGELCSIHHYGIKLDGDLRILVVFFKYSYLLQDDDFFPILQHFAIRLISVFE